MYSFYMLSKLFLVLKLFAQDSHDGLKPTTHQLPTTDSNKMEIFIIQEALRDLKIIAQADKQENALVSFEISKVKQESLTAAFQEEERKIRMDSSLIC